MADSGANCVAVIDVTWRSTFESLNCSGIATASAPGAQSATWAEGKRTSSSDCQVSIYFYSVGARLTGEFPVLNVTNTEAGKALCHYFLSKQALGAYSCCASL